MSRTRRGLRLSLSLAVLAALAIAPTAAHATHEPCTDELDNPVFTELKQWIKAPSQKIGNLAAFGQGSYPTWSGVEPTTSVQGGGGGASFQSRGGNPVNAFQYRPETSGYFEGAFTGCLDTMAWDLYLVSPVPPAGGNVVSRVQLTVDGNVVHLTPGDPGPDISAPAEGTSGVVYRMKFLFQGIHAAMTASPGDFQPIDGKHTITLTMFTQFVNDAQGFFAYDATDVPSHITFNKSTGVSAYTKLDMTV